MNRRLIWLVPTALSIGWSVEAAGANGNWRHTVLFYGMGAAIDGEATIGDLSADLRLRTPAPGSGAVTVREASRNASWIAPLGYRVIGFDYEDRNCGSRHYQRYDLTVQNPLAGIAFSP